MAALFSTGRFYYYILNFNTFEMEYVDVLIQSVLGIQPDDLKQMHNKEAKAVDFILNKIPADDILRYNVVYVVRYRHADGSYKTILQQSKALSLSEDGKVQQVLGIHTDVSYLKMPVDHKISFIGEGRPSFYAVSTDEDFKTEEYDYHKLLIHTKRIFFEKLIVITPPS